MRVWKKNHILIFSFIISSPTMTKIRPTLHLNRMALRRMTKWTLRMGLRWTESTRTRDSSEWYLWFDFSYGFAPVGAPFFFWCAFFLLLIFKKKIAHQKKMVYKYTKALCKDVCDGVLATADAAAVVVQISTRLHNRFLAQLIRYNRWCLKKFGLCLTRGSGIASETTKK